MFSTTNCGETKTESDPAHLTGRKHLEREYSGNDFTRLGFISQARRRERAQSRRSSGKGQDLLPGDSKQYIEQEAILVITLLVGFVGGVVSAKAIHTFGSLEEDCLKKRWRYVRCYELLVDTKDRLP